jgi:long-chain acyl-CoA synthetase
VNEHDISTLSALPFLLHDRFPKPVLLARCREHGFDAFSTAEVFERVRDLSLGLSGLGVREGDRVALISESRPEWGIADLANLALGAVTVPVYPTQSAPQVRYILNDSGSKIAVVSSPSQVQKIRQVERELQSLQAIVVIHGAVPPSRNGLPVLTMGELVRRGQACVQSDPKAPDRHRERALARREDELATIVYTSGTTGEPKGVMLTHRNMLSNVRATELVLPLDSTHVGLSFLPLSHVFERMVFYRCLYNGVTVYFAEGLSTVARDLARVRPTVMTGVPRFYEKFLAAIEDNVAKGSAARKRLFAWALRVGEDMTRLRLEGARPPVALALRHAAADRLVFSKIRARTGGRLRYLVSGSAPLPASVARFFLAIGLPIVEGYGLTETSPVVAANSMTAMRLGTVGKALPGVDIRLADDGEILVRGPNVMQGYYGKPQLTGEAVKDGWFYTGDIGAFDADGFLTITDRKKDLIVTSGGKKIAPQPIESLLKTDRLVAEAVVIGENRRFSAVLIVPNFPLLEARAKAEGWRSASHEDLIAAPAVVALYQDIVDQVNAGLAQFERIKKLALLPTEFTMERDELTPTMKVRRKVVEDRWKDVIARLYEEDERKG